jgi:hypothetical protein
LFHKCEGVVGVIGWTPSFASCGVAALIEENAHMAQRIFLIGVASACH